MGGYRSTQFGNPIRWPQIATLRWLAGCGCLLVTAASVQAQDTPAPLFPSEPGPVFVIPNKSTAADTSKPAALTAAPAAPDNGPALVAPPQAEPSAAAQPASLTVATQPADLNVVPPPAPAATEQPSKSTSAADLEARVHELEAIVQQMQTHSGQGFALPASASEQTGPTGPDSSNFVPPSPTGAYTGLTSPQASSVFANTSTSPFKGFWIKSDDNAFSLKITGQIQLDYREFLNTKDRTDIDTFLLRKARFGLEAVLFKYYEFRFLPDFGQGTSIVQDCFMNVHYWDEFQLEAGRFKQPISYEQLIIDRYVPTLERSIIDQLVPARDLGVMAHGEKMFNDRFEYAVSLSNGEINGNSTDLNNHKDMDGRIAVRPLNDPDLPAFLRGLQVGVSAGFGIEQEAVSPATLKTPDTVPFLTFNSTVRADGLRTRLCPEVEYFYGPLGLYAEYYDQHQDLRPSATGPGYKFLTDVPFTGYVFLGTLFLTGETRTTYNEQTIPLRNFDPRCPFTCPGAWELVGRVSRLSVGDVFNPGAAQLANPAKFSNEAMEFTIGFNWYFNPLVRMQFNYEHDMFGQPVALGSAPINQLTSQDSVFTRFQIIF